MATMTMATPSPVGLLQPGNIDLKARPIVKNADGSISTVRSMSFGEDAGEILVPTVSPDGKILSDDDAIKLYHQTGQHLGIFDNPADADAYAQSLHNQQDQMYSAPTQASAMPSQDDRVTLTVNGQKVKVGKEFLSLSPDAQNETVDEISKSLTPKQEEGSYWDTAKDMAASAASGVARGAADLVGLPGTIGDAFNNTLSSVTGLPQLPASPMSGDKLRSAESTVTGGATDYQPKTTAGKFASTVGEFAPGAVALGGAGVGNIIRSAVVPGVASEAAGQVTEGTSLEPAARIAGAVIGGVLPSVGARLITPFPVSAERAAANQVMANEGVDLTAGQRTGSVNLKNVESELGGTAAANRMEQQGEQFTRAALRRAGENANRATPEVVDQAFTRIGNDFDTLAANNQMMPDRAFAQELTDTMRTYNSLVGDSQRAPVVANTIADIGTQAQGGVLDGATYQAFRSRLDKDARAVRISDPQLSEALFGIRNAMDSSMERSIARNNPNDLGAWRDARREYRNMLVVEDAIAGAGENAAMGIISPAKLRAAAQKQNKRAYVRGRGDFNELAHAGAATMSQVPNSGTAGRTAARNFFTLMPTAIGGAGGGAAGGLPGAIMGAAAGTVAPALAGRALLSRPVGGYLANQLIPAAQTSERALIGAGTQGAIHEGAPQRQLPQVPDR